jgi:hypothetical protein
VNVAAHESFKAFAVGELHVQLAAVALHQAEGIKLARMALGLDGPVPSHR